MFVAANRLASHVYATCGAHVRGKLHKLLFIASALIFTFSSRGDVLNTL